VVTAITVVTYALAVVCGILLVCSVMEPVGYWNAHGMFIKVLAISQGAVLILGGALGVPSAWRGLWWLERVACFLLGWLGALLLVVGVLDVMGVIEATPYPLSASWFFGVVCWCAFCATRWQRVREQPYAPGQGPMPIHAAERHVERIVKAQDARIRADEKRHDVS